MSVWYRLSPQQLSKAVYMMNAQTCLGTSQTDGSSDPPTDCQQGSETHSFLWAPLPLLLPPPHLPAFPPPPPVSIEVHLIVFLTPRVCSSKVGHSVASKTFIVALFRECEIRLFKSTLSESPPWDQKHPVCLPLPHWPRIRQGRSMVSSPHSRNEGCVCPLHEVSAQPYALL